MKSPIRNLFALLLAPVTAIAVLTLSVPAGSGKPDLSGKSHKETAAGSDPMAISLTQAEEIALAHDGTDGAVFCKETLNGAVYRLQFHDAETSYKYQISAVDSSILQGKTDSCEPPCAANPAAPGQDSFQVLSQDFLKDAFYEGAISTERARQIALKAAGLDTKMVKHAACYVLWADHSPYAYEVKIATRMANCRYTVDLCSGAVLEVVCIPHR